MLPSMPTPDIGFARHRLPFWAIAVGFCLCSGCLNVQVESHRSVSPTARTDRPVVPSDWIRTELYFGRVPEVEWKRFLDTQITPRFPAGLTVLDAQGQWRAKDGVIHDVPTRILIILHPNDTATDQSLEEIRRAYTTEFHHESVLRADSPAKVRF